MNIKNTNQQYICEYCEKICKNSNSLTNHRIRCKNNPNRKSNLLITNYAMECAHKARRGKPSWCSGLTKETSEIIKKSAEKVHEKYLHGDLIPSFKGKHHSKKTRNKMSENARKNEFIKHFGFHKTYLYNGIKFHSSYEVELAKNLDLNNILWEKPKYGIFQYCDPFGKNHTYTPDFYLPEYNIYLDPKNDFLINHKNPTLGFSDIDKIKWVIEQNPGVKIFILSKNQLSWQNIKQFMERWVSPVETDPLLPD